MTRFTTLFTLAFALSGCSIIVDNKLEDEDEIVFNCIGVDNGVECEDPDFDPEFPPDPPIRRTCLNGVCEGPPCATAQGIGGGVPPATYCGLRVATGDGEMALPISDGRYLCNTQCTGPRNEVCAAGDDSTCIESQCGDGLVDGPDVISFRTNDNGTPGDPNDDFAEQIPGSEQCDDGNDVDGDGCDSDCTFSCESSDECPAPADSCTRTIECNPNTHRCEPMTQINGSPCMLFGGLAGTCCDGTCRTDGSVCVPGGDATD